MFLCLSTKTKQQDCKSTTGECTVLYIVVYLGKLPSSMTHRSIFWNSSPTAAGPYLHRHGNTWSVTISSLTHNNYYSCYRLRKSNNLLAQMTYRVISKGGQLVLWWYNKMVLIRCTTLFCTLHIRKKVVILLILITVALTARRSLSGVHFVLQVLFMWRLL